jgi:hypothetical protein
MLRNYDVPDQFYPIGELEQLEPLQHELNKARSQLASYRRKQARKYLVQKSAVSQEGLSALASNEDNAIVYITEDVPLDNVVKVLAQDNMDAQLYQYSDVMQMDMDRISGVSEYQRGQLSEINRTATEAAIIQDAANARASDKLAQVEGAATMIGRRMVQLAQQYVTGEQTVRITGPNGAMAWIKFTREDIQGEFDFEVESGSTQPKNETFRRQQAMQMLNTLGPFMGTILDPVKVLTQVMRDGFGISNPEQYIMQAQPQIDPATGQPVPPGPPDAENPQEQSAPTEEGDGPPGARAQLQGQVGLSQPQQSSASSGGALGPGGV